MRLLDLFCCEGGAAMGYMAAGWEVTGVDLLAKYGRRYPGTYVQADALDFLVDYGDTFDAIHASPPCQLFTQANAAHQERTQARHHDYISPTRVLLREIGRPWVMENVPRAPLRDPLVLCGSMFGLSATDTDGTPLVLRRHRWFESSHPLTAPQPCSHERGVQIGGVYGGARADKESARGVRHGGYVPARKVQAELMGIDWMTGHGLTQAVPPAYTQHLGAQLMELAHA